MFRGLLTSIERNVSDDRFFRFVHLVVLIVLLVMSCAAINYKSRYSIYEHIEQIVTQMYELCGMSSNSTDFVAFCLCVYAPWSSPYLK